MSGLREARLARRQRQATSARIAAEAAKLTYCTAGAGSDATHVEIEYEGLVVGVPKLQVYAHKMPVAGDRVLVHENDGELNIIGCTRGP